ncbi:MAG: mercury(II) reductase [Thermodesulfobacteriota bacterium]
MAKRNQIIIRVEGMTCDGCARHVTEALKNVSGVEEIMVPSWKSGQATVIAESKVTDEVLIRAIREAGYRGVVRERHTLEEERRAPVGEGADYDLIVIGGGSASFAAAIKASELGAKVAIVEAGTIGGTCVNIGCVPSKTLIRAAEICYKSAYPRFEGLTACPPPSEWQRVIQQKRELVASLREGKYVHVLDIYPNITLIRGRAKLTGKRSVSIDGKTYTPGKIVIATGSRPWAPPITGLKEAGYLDSTDALSLEALPQSMLVIGGGTIGLELGQLFSRFGVLMTILQADPHVAAAEEPEISEALAKYLAEEKVRVYTGAHISRVEKVNEGRRVYAEIEGKEHTFTAEQIVVTTGRIPNTNDLGLEVAGVEIGKRGEIIVNEHLQTSNPDIYAAGDVIGDPMYVYVAAYAGGLAAENAITGAGRIYDLFALPRVTFTDPQIASVGLTEAQASERGLKAKTLVLSLNDVPRALAARDTRGLIKLVAEEETGRLLGAHVLAAEAGDVIQEATLAIRFGLTVQDLVETFHPYLTMVEGLKLAALTFEKDVTKLSCCAA